MNGLDEIRRTMTECLCDRGIDAVSAYPGGGRTAHAGAVAAVSIRSFDGKGAGFGNSLGEWYDEEKGTWEEHYGIRARVTFGLDLFAGAEQSEELEDAFDDLLCALHEGLPQGLRAVEITAGEVRYDRDAGMLRRDVQAVCEASLWACADESGAFTDFRIKGEYAT